MVRRRPPLAADQSTQTACARALLRGGVDEHSGEIVPAGVLASRVGWCAELVSGIAAALLAEHWNRADVARLASGVDAAGQRLPSQAWMALRRLGWTAGASHGARVNDRIVRMAQEQAGRLLRSADWRAELTAGVLATWPADPVKRTAAEWQAVREAIPGGRHLPGSVVKARTRQIAAYAQARGWLKTNTGIPSAMFRSLLLSGDGIRAATSTGPSDDHSPDRALRAGI